MFRNFRLSFRLLASVSVISFIAITGPLTSGIILYNISQQTRLSNETSAVISKKADQVSSLVDSLPNKIINLNNPLETISLIKNIYKSNDINNTLNDLTKLTNDRIYLLDNLKIQYELYKQEHEDILQLRNNTANELSKTGNSIRAKMISLIAEIRRNIASIVNNTTLNTTTQLIAVYETNDIKIIIDNARKLNIDLFELDDLIEAKTDNDKIVALNNFRKALIDDISITANAKIGKTDNEMQIIIGDLAKQSETLQQATLDLAIIGTIIDGLSNKDDINESIKLLHDIIVKHENSLEFRQILVKLKTNNIINYRLEILSLDKKLLTNNDNVILTIDNLKKYTDLLIKQDIDKSRQLLDESNSNADIASIFLWIITGIASIITIFVSEIIIRRSIIIPLSQANELLNKVMKGHDIPSIKIIHNDEITQITKAAIEIDKDRKIKEANQILENNRRIKNELRNNKLNEIVNKFNLDSQLIADDLIYIMNQISATATELLSISIEATKQSSATTKMAVEALQYINNTTDVLNDVTTSISSINEQASQLKEQTIIAVDKSNQSANFVKTMDESLSDIHKSSKNITEIAHQSKMLAINARIETQTIKNNTSGFAVIADEIKNISMAIHDQSTEISKISLTAGQMGEQMSASVSSIQDIIFNTSKLAENVNQNTLIGLDKSNRIKHLSGEISERIKTLVGFVEQVDYSSESTQNAIKIMRIDFEKALNINNKLMILLTDFSKSVSDLFNERD